MNILHVNAYDHFGGAARAAYRIHWGLLNSGMKSTMFVQQKKTNEPQIFSPYNSKLKKTYAKLRPFFNTYFQKLQATTNPILHSSNILPSGLHRAINNSDADIVHLHWISNEMISIREVGKIKKPIVWTLHDMWAFSGAEHYDTISSFGRYKKGYTSNNRLLSDSGFDIDYWTWKRKKRYWSGDMFTFVTPSNWLAEGLKNSQLFKDQIATVIPNGLDIKMFKPIDKKIARKILNLPFDKKIILYGAISAESSCIKGYDYLIKSLDYFKNKKELLLNVFGGSYEHSEILKGIKVKHFGTIDENHTLSLIYSAADVMVVPSLKEAFGQTASESLACGTPVAAFNTSGLKDIVDHKVNGYLAKKFDAEDLSAGINWILEHPDQEKLSRKCREKAEEKFDIRLVSEQYINLYKKVLEQHN